jgi:hypothetical protein
MRLTDASLAIRPRSAWEALDLGTLMARRHLGLLMASWALVSLPVLLLLSLLLWRHPVWALLLFWWLKPAFERLPLYILSHALFHATPSLGESLRALPRLLRPQLLASLTWRRFSPSRSFDLPVLQLEGLGGSLRSQRLNVLGQRDSSTAGWLTVCGLLLEACLYFGLISLVYLFIPQQLVDELDWQKLVTASDGEWLWLDHLRNLLYALVLVLWEPIYVACGFSLYLNRRTVLEAWDIELAFRRLRQRLTGSAYAVLLAALLLLGQFPGQALAADSCQRPESDFIPDSLRQPDEPPAERLLNQALTGPQARQEIAAILAAAPFENSETVTRWRLIKAEEEDAEPEEEEEERNGLFDKLRLLAETSEVLQLLVQAFRLALWALLIGLLVLLVWRYREWLRTFVSRLGLPQRRRREPPSMLFGLEVSPQSLPDDIASSAEQLWQDNPREALGLLYRGLLSRLLHDYRLPLKGSHTEGEVLQRVLQLDQAELSDFSRLLTGHWQNLAYGHRLPPQDARDSLCNGWRRQFPREARA